MSVPERPHSETELIVLACHGDHLHLDANYTLSWGIDSDGVAWPLLFDECVSGRCRLPYGPSLDRDAPAHERLGRLPPMWRERLQHHCGAPTRKGRPCRIVVDHAGDRCDIHRDDGP
jgi:hypothetical protein